MKFRHKKDDADILVDLDVGDRIVCFRAQANGGQMQNIAVMREENGKLVLELKEVIDAKLREHLHESGIIEVLWPKSQEG